MKLDPLIEEVLAEIAILKEQSELRMEKDDPLSLLNAHMIVAWADLHDTLSPKLIR